MVMLISQLPTECWLCEGDTQSGLVASDIDTRKSVTGYLMVLNGGPISWKASRQGGVTLSSREAEFVAASQAGQEVLYLRALLKGFAYLQHGPTEI
jgi:hypothetical protein